VSRKKSIVLLSIIALVIILGTVFAFVDLDNGQLGIYDYIGYPKGIKLGLDLKGGVYAVFEADEENTEGLAERMEGTVDSLEELLFDKGYTEATVTLQSGNRIRVEVPDVEDPETIFQLIGRPAKLEFKKDEESDPYVTGEDLKSAYVSTDENGSYVVAIEFDDEGTEKFKDATTERLNQTISIYINGEEKLSPTVESVISNGKATISNGSTGYTYEEAYELAVSIQAGAFAVNLKLIESRTISPTLGVDALRTGIIAGAIGIALVFIFMALVYRMLGVVADIALALYIIVLLFFFSIFPWVQLTLPGIAGIILSIGMAVDANVIIFARIRDEYGSGKTIRTSVKEGFRKATSAILDSNVTTIIGAIVLWAVGATAIKGFAITLLTGIILSLFTAMVISRVLVQAMLSFNDENPMLYNLGRHKEDTL
jgi:preprotein translocase subunit SecD